MIMAMNVKCPGCGLDLPDINLENSDRYNASGECWQLNNELTAFFMMNPDLTFRAQHAVDAYGAQHSGGVTKNVTIAYSLIGLYLALERGQSGRQVQQAHMELAKKSIQWPSLALPARSYSLTIADVLNADETTRNDILMKWAQCVWDAWKEHHEWTKHICSMYL
jgi:hypothetical protein